MSPFFDQSRDELRRGWLDAWRRGAGRWLRAYALAVSVGTLILSAYLAAWGMIGFRSWAY